MSPGYYLDLPDSGAPLRWDPHAGPRKERPDTRYFGGVLATMEGLLEDPEIDVYLTWSAERLPSYGSRVVAVLLGDEAGRIPRYAADVRAVFKCFGTIPTLGSGLLRSPDLSGLLQSAQYAFRWIKWLPGGALHARSRGASRLGSGRAVPPVMTIPVGTCNQLDIPVKPILDRTTDVFFAGSLEHGTSLRDRIGTPKTRARRKCLRAVGELKASEPKLALDLRVTDGFGQSIAMSPEIYSAALMNAKVCLAPRGTATETWRVYEGLRYGCLVVSDRLPGHRFLKGAPVLQLDRWDELERKLSPVLHEPEELERWHLRALEWWRLRCSEVAVGTFMAEQLNALAPGASAERTVTGASPTRRFARRSTISS